MPRLLTTSLLTFIALAAFACGDKDSGPSPESSYATKKTGGAVMFDFTPRFEGSKLVVDVGVNTHSGDLAELDLSKLLALEVDGSTLRPTTASTLRGHHARAEVSFEVGGRPERFALSLGAVRNVGPQRLEWP